ncbi:MAG: glutamate synthase-related protein [Anaerovoracaceae bacterium]|jgi:glutamate synthase domain-containing protein 2
MVFICNICGHVFDEELEGMSIDQLTECPSCMVPSSHFRIKEDGAKDEIRVVEKGMEGEGAQRKGSGKIYVCSICGHVFDEELEGMSIDQLTECPSCMVPSSYFRLKDGDNHKKLEESKPIQELDNLEYDRETSRSDGAERCMADIHQMAVSGNSIIEAMGVREIKPSWEDIFILGAQLDPMPLDENADVNISTVIGKKAAKPMILEMPVYVSHMSFGALSREIKIALAKGSAMAKTAMCSGEGGILPEERDSSYRYIFEYVPNKYSVTDENLLKSHAIEIKIGQGTKPGMGGHLPGDKVTEEISRIRNKPMGQDIISPSKFEGVETKDDLKRLVEELRERSGGRPIGIKLAAGKIERDLAFAVYAGPDFVTIDGRGGATGASPKLLRNATSMPTIYALRRARKYLDSINSDVELVITGGLRVSSDFAKAIALGADAVAIASAALIAAACQQYKLCHKGYCPVGVATQDPELRKRMHVEAAAQRLYNFLNVSGEELKTYGRITGNPNIHDLSLEDLCTIDRGLAEYADIPHA